MGGRAGGTFERAPPAASKGHQFTAHLPGPAHPTQPTASEISLAIWDSNSKPPHHSGVKVGQASRLDKKDVVSRMGRPSGHDEVPWLARKGWSGPFISKGFCQMGTHGFMSSPCEPDTGPLHSGVWPGTGGSTGSIQPNRDLP